MPMAKQARQICTEKLGLVHPPSLPSHQTNATDRDSRADRIAPISKRFLPPNITYLTIRQRGRVVYELIVNEGAARVDYLFRDNEAELSNCFSIHSYPILPKIQIVRDIGKIAPKITVKSL